MSNPIEDLKSVLAREMEMTGTDNPILVPESLYDTAVRAAKDNNILVKIEPVKAAWYRKKAEELRGNAMSSGIKPLSENVAQQLADAIEESNKAQQELNECLPELTDNIFRMVEDEIAAELLINTRRLATASFLTRRYWKRKVEKSKAALEETHKEFDAWRKVYHK